jgi:hypothetical protein
MYLIIYLRQDAFCIKTHCTKSQLAEHLAHNAGGLLRRHVPYATLDGGDGDFSVYEITPVEITFNTPPQFCPVFKDEYAPSAVPPG